MGIRTWNGERGGMGIRVWNGDRVGVGMRIWNGRQGWCGNEDMERETGLVWE